VGHQLSPVVVVTKIHFLIVVAVVVVVVVVVDVLGDGSVGADSPEAAQDGCQGHGGGAGGRAEPVFTLTIDMNSGAVNLGAAPLLPLVISAIDPLCARHVGHPIEGEGEDAVTARVRT